MRTETPPLIRLEEYRPSNYLIDRVDLDIRLDPHATRITRRWRCARIPPRSAGAPLILDGDDLRLVSVALDGAPLAADAYVATQAGLSLSNPPARPFILRSVTEVDPTANTKLMGLYRSSGVYCTQCEADGFRRITYFLDRPDVMAVYTTRIEADRTDAPVLLGNGNLVDSGLVGARAALRGLARSAPEAGLPVRARGRPPRQGRDPLHHPGREAVTCAVYVEPGKEDRARLRPRRSDPLHGVGRDRLRARL